MKTKHNVGFEASEEPATTDRKKYIEAGDFYPGRGKRPASIPMDKELQIEDETPTAPRPFR